jgi:hypothetical protein
MTKRHKYPKEVRVENFITLNPYRTKVHNLARSKNAPNTTKFWPTSSGSSEFGQNYLPHQFDLLQKPHSQTNFPTDHHSNTMPTTKKIEIIRLQQAAVVTNLVEIARYTHTKPVYTEMTQQEFNKTIRNLNRISTLYMYPFYQGNQTWTNTSTENRPLCSLLQTFRRLPRNSTTRK